MCLERGTDERGVFRDAEMAPGGSLGWVLTVEGSGSMALAQGIVMTPGHLKHTYAAWEMGS